MLGLIKVQCNGINPTWRGSTGFNSIQFTWQSKSTLSPSVNGWCTWPARAQTTSAVSGVLTKILPYRRHWRKFFGLLTAGHNDLCPAEFRTPRSAKHAIPQAFTEGKEGSFIHQRQRKESHVVSGLFDTGRCSVQFKIISENKLPNCRRWRLRNSFWRLARDEEIRVEEKSTVNGSSLKSSTRTGNSMCETKKKTFDPEQNSTLIRLSWIPPRFNLVKLLGRLREGSSPSPQHSFPLPFHTFFRTPFCDKLQSDLIRMRMWFFAWGTSSYAFVATTSKASVGLRDVESTLG